MRYQTELLITKLFGQEMTSMESATSLIDSEIDRSFAFRESLTPETDRGCAIIAAAFLDEELAKMLKAHLVDHASLIKDTFNGQGGLATFSSRIGLSFLMGLISPSVYADLTLIRRIRNMFAHDAMPITFEDTAVAARCREFSLTGRGHGASSRQHFTSTCCQLLAFIHTQTWTAKRAVSPKDILDSEESKRALRDGVYAIIAGLAESHGVPPPKRDEF